MDRRPEIAPFPANVSLRQFAPQCIEWTTTIAPQFHGRVVGKLAVLIIAATIALAGCDRQPPVVSKPVVGPIQLKDVSDQVGIEFVHTDGSSGQRYIVEPMSAGLALFDYDDDGFIDIYFLNGRPLLGADMSAKPRNALYRNLGDWKFVDVTEQAGVGDMGFGLGVTVGDYDNDGIADLYVNNYGPNVLYRNNGDGTFSDVTQHAKVDNGQLVGAGACFLDMDSDGDLDLYAANYIDFDPTKNVQRTFKGYPSYPSPRDFYPVPDTLFRNEGDGTFTDVSESSGISQIAGTGMGMVCIDGDDDGDTDIFVLNDFGENFYYENDGKGVFEEVAVLVGLAYNAFGLENASMGVDSGDIDNDGLIDFFMTCYQNEYTVLYRNIGGGNFEDISQLSQAGPPAYAYVNWGANIVDFDNDADRDLFISNGHTEDNIDLYDSSTAYKASNMLLMNDGKAKFADVSNQCGDGLAPVCSSRGSAWDDLDNDGDIDGVIANARESPTILRNDSPNNNHWVDIHLIGRNSTRDAIGARVHVTAGGLTQVAEKQSGRGYQSHYGSRIHFGLGEASRIDRIEVQWMGGGSDELVDVAVDQVVIIQEGDGR
jgi:hypothetical protein